MELPGFEADDVLGTVSLICEQNGDYALIVTGDRDAYQLAGEYTSILLTKKGISETETVTPEWIKEKYGLTPAQMIDVKSLMGDASDNIPGVAGIGEKTALKLINEFGSLENLLACAETQLKGSVREKILNGRQSALDSRFLAEINRSVPLKFDFEACRVQPFDGALPLLKRLRLKSILQRIEPYLSGEAPVSVAAPAREVNVTRTDKDGMRAECARILSGAKLAAVVIGDSFSVCTDAGEALFAEMGGDLLSAGIESADIYAALRPLAEDRGITAVFYNVKALPFDISAFEGRSEDLMLALYVINPQADCKDLSGACAELDADYDSACPAASLLDAWTNAEKRLNADGEMRLYRETELPLAYVLREMEDAGFRVDTEYLEKLGKVYKRRLDDIGSEIYHLAGREININSPKQLKQLLFEEMKLPVPGGRKNAGSTSAEVLEALAGDYPICEKILEYRKYQKLNSTYVEGLVPLADSDGRIHTRFEQAVTGTGRISSREPNLQNIPVRTELGREIRRAFIPAEGCCLIDADYSQIELRVLAHMSGDANMRDAFISGQDIHARTASEVFHVPLDEVTHEMRSAAKAVNFGIVYGISEYGLAKNTGSSVREAAGYIEEYLKRYPDVKRFMDECVRTGRENGYVTTLMGRRRYLPELSAASYQMRSFGERAAMNSPIQGTAADIIKLAMVNTAKELKRRGLKTRLLLQVHDELILEAPASEAQKASELLRDCMENAVRLSVPLVCEVGMGGNWNECKP